MAKCMQVVWECRQGGGGYYILQQSVPSLMTWQRLVNRRPIRLQVRVIKTNFFVTSYWNLLLDGQVSRCALACPISYVLSLEQQFNIPSRKRKMPYGTAWAVTVNSINLVIVTSPACFSLWILLLSMACWVT